MKSAVLMIFKLFRINMKKRYLGSKLGLLWVIFQPLMTLIMYIVIFGFVLKSKVPGSNSSLDYVIWFLCGLSPWLAISEGISSTSSSIISNINIIKNFAIKSEYIPIALALTGSPQMLVVFVVVIILSAFSGLGISWYALWLVIICPLLFMFVAGLGLFLSSICVFKRDIIQLIPTVLQFCFYFTPIFYGIEQLPHFVTNFVFFNPFYQICDCFRQILFYQNTPNILGILYVIFVTILLWIGGLLYFKKTKGFFESVL